MKKSLLFLPCILHALTVFSSPVPMPPKNDATEQKVMPESSGAKTTLSPSQSDSLSSTHSPGMLIEPKGPEKKRQGYYFDEVFSRAKEKHYKMVSEKYDQEVVDFAAALHNKYRRGSGDTQSSSNSNADKKKMEEVVEDCEENSKSIVLKMKGKGKKTDKKK